MIRRQVSNEVCRKSLRKTGSINMDFSGLQNMNKVLGELRSLERLLLKAMNNFEFSFLV